MESTLTAQSSVNFQSSAPSFCSSGASGKIAAALARSVQAALSIIGDISFEDLRLSNLSLAGSHARDPAAVEGALNEIARTVQGTLGTLDPVAEVPSSDVELSTEDWNGGSIAWLRSERCVVGVWRHGRASTTPFVALMMRAGQAFPPWRRDLARMALIHQSERQDTRPASPAQPCGISLPEVLLRSIALGLMVVDTGGNVVLSNDPAKTWCAESGFVELVAGRLTARRADVRERVQGALRIATAEHARRLVVVPLPRKEGEEDGPLSRLLTFVPLHLATPHALLICGARPSSDGLSDLVLEALGLTHSERRLACSLIRGHRLEEAAREANVTTSTARSYLKRIFTKTGVRRQSELVAAIMAVTPPLQLDIVRSSAD